MYAGCQFDSGGRCPHRSGNVVEGDSDSSAVAVVVVVVVVVHSDAVVVLLCGGEGVALKCPPWVPYCICSKVPVAHRWMHQSSISIGVDVQWCSLVAWCEARHRTSEVFVASEMCDELPCIAEGIVVADAFVVLAMSVVSKQPEVALDVGLDLEFGLVVGLYSTELQGIAVVAPELLLALPPKGAGRIWAKGWRET